jgi:hypothetical protein
MGYEFDPHAEHPIPPSGPARGVDNRPIRFSTISEQDRGKPAGRSYSRGGPVFAKVSCGGKVIRSNRKSGGHL